MGGGGGGERDRLGQTNRDRQAGRKIDRWRHTEERNDDGWMDGCIDRWINGWVDEWTDGRTDGWTDR